MFNVVIVRKRNVDKVNGYPYRILHWQQSFKDLWTALQHYTECPDEVVIVKSSDGWSIFKRSVNKISASELQIIRLAKHGPLIETRDMLKKMKIKATY